MPTLVAGPQTLLSAVTATTAQGVLPVKGESNNLTVVLQGTGTTSGGTVAVEVAYYDLENGPIYAGTWSPITTLNASDVSGGKQVEVNAQGSFWAVRVRVATTITGGGTVTAYAWAN